MITPYGDGGKARQPPARSRQAGLRRLHCGSVRAHSCSHWPSRRRTPACVPGVPEQDRDGRAPGHADAHGEGLLPHHRAVRRRGDAVAARVEPHVDRLPRRGPRAPGRRPCGGSPGGVQRTVARTVCWPAALHRRHRWRHAATTWARTRWRSACCRDATVCASSWAHWPATAPARGAATSSSRATTSVAHASTTSERRRSGLRRQRQPRTRVRMRPPRRHADECPHGGLAPFGVHGFTHCSRRFADGSPPRGPERGGVLSRRIRPSRGDSRGGPRVVPLQVFREPLQVVPRPLGEPSAEGRAAALGDRARMCGPASVRWRTRTRWSSGSTTFDQAARSRAATWRLTVDLSSAWCAARSVARQPPLSSR